MITPSALTGAQATALFCSETGHVPLPLRRLPNARVLWLNLRYMHCDAHYVGGTQTYQAYADHVLKRCAFVLDDGGDDADASECAVGYADRYGGDGIGHNGGSGRAVNINGYHVKGVGRTPLISALTDRAHASGGAYLEECIRETILSEVTCAEFPHGAVPVVAIIETGMIQVWEEDDGPRSERMCLLVRPSFIRPAHFERATWFRSDNPKEGLEDARRVRQMIAAVVHNRGPAAVRDLFGKFWERWIDQLAYAFVHRLTHGGNTTSNICLDGRLLDFGAMTALPSWATTHLTMGALPTGCELVTLAQCVTSLHISILRAGWSPILPWEQPTAFIACCADLYRKRVLIEVLRVLGLTRRQADRMVAGPAAARLAELVTRLLQPFIREQNVAFNGFAKPRIPWELDHVWESPMPGPLRAICELIEQELGSTPATSSDPAGEHRSLVARNRLRARTRDDLFQKTLKTRIYAETDGAYCDRPLPRDVVGRLIDTLVTACRGDSPHEPDDGDLVGFARNPEASYTLFRERHTNAMFAFRDPYPGPLPANGGHRLTVRDMSAASVLFDVGDAGDAGNAPEFSGTVRVIHA